VLVMVAYCNCPVEDAVTCFTYVTLWGTASVIRNQWGDRIQTFIRFWACYETAKFTWDQPDWLGNLE
jgi:hypothetical protein